MSLTTTQTIELETGRYTVENGVLILRFFDIPDREFSIHDADEHIAACIELSHGRKLPFLIDVRDATDVAKFDILKYIANYEAIKETCWVRAYLTNSLGVKLKMHYYINITDQVYLSRIFKEEENALEWLGHYAEKIDNNIN